MLSQVTKGAMSAVTAANVLGLSRRQVHRLLMGFQTEGPAGIRHKARGRRSNNRTDPAMREFTVTLVRENYIDFGPSFAAEKLAEDHDLKMSRETLRKWMQDAGIWLSRKQRRTFHQPRLRWECYGELIQIDGSNYRWFEDRGPAYTLLAFIDDATSTLIQLRDVFCFRDERLVSKQLAFSYGRQRIILAENEITRDLPGKYVDTFAFPDGQFKVRWKGVSIPYTVFDKDQRVTHAAITENKHLSAVLEHIKAEQDQAPPKKTTHRQTDNPLSTHRQAQRRLEL